MRPLLRLLAVLLPALALPAGAATAVPALTIETYHPGDKAVFAVASVMVEGRHDAVLIDAQFARSDAQRLVERIRASGRRLTTIYVSHGDPDYYFGLETLHAAFPDARILASAPTVAHIQATRQAKLAYWGPILKDEAPQTTLVPAVLDGRRIELEGEALDVVGLDGPTPDRSFVWIPALKAVVGGIPVVAGEHVWMADTQTPESHRQWLATLDRIEALHPRTVVPGHFVPGAAQGLAAVRFTRDYIRAYDDEAARAKDAAALVAAMKRRYPTLGGLSALQLSAKVSKGEMTWP